MASPGSFASGFGAAIIGIFTSFVLFLGVALSAEKIIATFESTDVYDVPLEWGGYDGVMFWMNLLYIISIAPALLGLIVMFMSSIRTQEYDVLGDPDSQNIPSQISSDELMYYNQRE